MAENISSLVVNRHHSPISNYRDSSSLEVACSVQGLEDQLLSVIVKYERPELEQRRETLIQETRWTHYCHSTFRSQILEELMSVCI